MTSKYLYKAGDKVVCIQPKSNVGSEFDLPKDTILTVDEDTPAKFGTVSLEGYPKRYSVERFRLAGVGEIATAQMMDQGAPVLAPDTNPKTRYGLAKPPLGLIPGTARVLLAQAFADGVAKYGPANWRESPVSASTYVNAAERHLTSWYDGEAVASDSGVHHLAHAAACLLILLDAEANGTLNDDRPPPGKTGELIKQLTKPTP